ncbi:MAG TPA: tol-pal system protein YbgF [Rhizobiales bacterium]|nr:tol-pal system protein YbgF [Hyphomicrobiales bacterium]
MLAGNAAMAQNAQWNALFDRIIRLEAKVRSMQGGGATGQQAGGATSAQMRAVFNELRQMRLRLDSMDARLRALERRNGRQGRLLPRQRIQPRRQPVQPPRTATIVPPRQPQMAPQSPDNFALNDLDQFNGGEEPRVFVEMGPPKPFTPPPVTAAPATPRAPGQWQLKKPGGQVASLPPATVPGAGNGALTDGAVERRPLDGNQPTPKSEAQVLFERSSAALRSRRFGAAEAGFKSLLSKYGRDPLASDAQFMLGETYYAQRNYRLAAQTYLRGYRKYSSGRRAADTLLKLGMSLNKLGQKAQACGAFEQVQSKYKSAGKTAAMARQEMKRAGC